MTRFYEDYAIRSDEDRARVSEDVCRQFASLHPKLAQVMEHCNRIINAYRDSGLPTDREKEMVECQLLICLEIAVISQRIERAYSMIGLRQTH